jgi:hypothetical protein
MLDRFPVNRVVTRDFSPAAKSRAAAFLGEASKSAETEPSPEVTAWARPLLKEKLLDAKVRLHQRLIEEINLSALEKMPEEQIRQHVSELVSKYIVAERLVLNSQELDDFVTEILNEMTGLGSIEPLLKDPTVGDIMINGPDCVYIERAGVIERTQGASRTKPIFYVLSTRSSPQSAAGSMNLSRFAMHDCATVRG